MIRVNLQPRVIVEAKEGFQMPVWVPVLMGIIALVACGSVYWYLSFTIADMQAQAKSLDNKIEDFQTVLADYDTASDDHDYLKAKRDFVQNISTNQHKWIDFLDMLKNKMPKDVWIEKMSVDQNGDFKIDGNTYSYDSIANFMYRLSKFPQLKGITLSQAGSKGGGGSAKGGSVEDSMTKMFKISGTAAIIPEPASGTAKMGKRPGGVGAGGKAIKKDAAAGAE